MVGEEKRGGRESRVELSVCIPTYNRAGFLPEAFDSILRAAGGAGGVQICVSDNASTDGTRALVESYGKKHPGLFKYRRNQENLGFDRNLLQAVAMADGEYCWLFGSDDAMEEGAIREALSAIRARPAVVTADYRTYDFTLTKRQARDHRSGLASRKENEAFAGKEGIRRFVWHFFDHFGYISAQIVRREDWKKAAHGLGQGDYSPGYVHLFVILRMLSGAGSAYYIASPLVRSRSGNDSFTGGDEEGPLRRCLLDLDGYTKAADSLLGQWGPKLRRDMMIRVMRDYMPQHLSRIKKSKAPLRKKAEVWRRVMGAYWWIPDSWVRLFPLMIVPRPAFIALRNAYRSVRKRG